MKFEFGQVVTADMWDVRIMLVCPVVVDRSRSLTGYGARPGNWWGIVLWDSEGADGWQPGEMITLAEDNAGLRIVDTSGGTE